MIWEMCETKEQFYENNEATYRVQEYTSDYDMDNIQALSWFLDYLDFEDEDIIYNEGAQCQVKVKDKVFQIDSYGFGDFFSHQFDVIEIADTVDEGQDK
jgi:hypothetical protein